MTPYFPCGYHKSPKLTTGPCFTIPHIQNYHPAVSQPSACAVFSSI
ncbi:hypothetical protein HMPREF9406_3336 [Clostridium sp. HGF2]|nr:hypothetical protein HMPREF9406_3336 [Clostridium sp. HGF2]EQJ61767.1 hypothetical protein QSI_0929 [Clostridioides difficile P28]